ncbi:MAG: neutral/alkaline non-lysosomal ceramidase N-terminal domain-containing protein [Actinomycetota bacterium]|nr:neutral/alkaline non-lysosomal ceramidase N-terminal domain-containing protein [Actinomycetota bacterium]
MRKGTVAMVAGLFATLAVAAPAHAGELRAGISRVDITPPTGYYMMGWVRSDAKPIGVWTRLYARAIVLERDGHKVALVAEDLNGIPGGMLQAAAQLDADRGFSEANVLDSASHTHAGPAGFYNFSTYNTVFMSANSLTDFNLTGGLDPSCTRSWCSAWPWRSGGPTTTSPPPPPAGATPPCSGSPRTAASRRTWPTTGSWCPSAPARSPRTRWATRTRSTRRWRSCGWTGWCGDAAGGAS